MANKKFTDLDPASSLTGTDLLAVTLDPSGTPISRKASITQLMGQAPVQSVAGRTGAVTLSNTDISGLGTAATTASTDYATAAQGTTADSAVQPTDSIDVLSDVDTSTVAPTDGQALVWDSTAGQWEPGAAGASNLNALGDVSINNPADGSILKYVTANSQYEEASLGTASTANTSDFATSAQGALADTAVQPASIANMVETTDSIDVLSDVDTSTVSPTPDDLLKWDGSNFVPGTVSVDVDTPLNTALRGTTNPHIGAYPNQSFKVTDNPYKSVMVIADADGNLEFVTKDGANVFVNTPSSRLALAKGFSIQADGAEPDIEAVDTDGTTYSVISGDTDTKGANGLPTRQGFNLPDIGANPAPLLISGGSIA